MHTAILTTIAALLAAEPMAPPIPVSHDNTLVRTERPAHLVEARPTSRPPAIDLSVLDLSTVTVIDASTNLALPGATRPAQQVTLSTQFDTMLSEVLVEEGQSVRAGDVIAVLDDRVARTSLRLAEQAAANTSAIERARAALDRAQTILDRTESAVASGAANSDELDAARSQVTIAAAELGSATEAHDRAALELTLARDRVEQHLIRAPFDATVLRVHTDPGSVLATKDPIADLATLDRVRVDLYLPSSAVRSLAPGSLCALDLGEPIHAVLPAAVRYVEQRIDPTSRTQRVVFDFVIPGAVPPIGLLVHAAERAPTHTDIVRATTQPARVADALPAPTD